MDSLEEQLLERDAIRDELRMHPLRAQQKRLADLRRTHENFVEGELVWLKLQPYYNNRWLGGRSRNYHHDSMGPTR